MMMNMVWVYGYIVLIAMPYSVCKKKRESADIIHETEEGIFGGSSYEILKKHPDLKFFQNWLSTIDKIYDLNALSANQVKEYSALKLKVNVTPDMEIPAGSEMFVFRLARDFLRELEEPFITKRTTQVMRDFYYADPKNSNAFQSMWNGNNIRPKDRHLLICNEIHQLYKDDPKAHIQYRMFKWFVQLAAKLSDCKETVAAVVDLMQLPVRIENDVFKYLLDNRSFLFFKNDDLWTVLGGCHCLNYADKLQPFSREVKAADVKLCDSENGIFGRTYRDYMQKYGNFDFLLKWMKKIPAINDLSQEFEWEPYLLLKNRLNQNVNALDSITDGTQQFIFRLIGAFFAELPQPIIPYFTMADKFMSTAGAEEKNIQHICAYFDSIRRSSFYGYNSIKLLTNCAVGAGDTSQSAQYISAALTRPNFQLNSNDLKYLIDHHERIFADTSSFEPIEIVPVRCLPKPERERKRIAFQNASELARATNGIFGKTLGQVISQRGNLSFFFDWIGSIKNLHDLSRVENDMSRYRLYYWFKMSINVQPAPLPELMHDELRYYLVFDFLDQQPESFASFFRYTVTTFTLADKNHIFLACDELEKVRVLNEIVYRMLQRLIEFGIAMGKDEKAASAVGQLIQRTSYYPRSFSADQLLILMNNHSKIFIEPMKYDAGNSKCQPDNVRKKLQMERKSKIECQQQENGIFGNNLDNILDRYPDLKFFHHWLSRLPQIYELPDDANDLPAFAQYLKIKAEFNTNPNKSIDGTDGIIIFRLVRDFIRELTHPFLPIWFWTYGDPTEQRVLKACSYLNQLQPAIYKMLEGLIDFAIKHGDSGQRIAKLIEHPNRNFYIEDIRLLIQNKQRIFSAPMTGDVGTSRCRPPNVRTNLILAEKTRKQIEGVQSRIFGRTLNDILKNYPNLEFFFAWCVHVVSQRQFPDDFKDDANSKLFADYMQLKASMNTNPNQSLANVTEESALRLIKDFLTELGGSFLQNAAIFEIIPDAYIEDRYVFPDDRPFDLCLRLQTFRFLVHNQIEYKIFRTLIKLSERLYNKPVARSDVSKLMRIPQRSTLNKNYSLAYFFEKHDTLFINDANQTKESIANACERNAYKRKWMGGSLYANFVINSSRRNRNSSNKPDYDGNSYENFNKNINGGVAK